MDAKKLKKEILGIVKFEGVAMSSNEIWKTLTLDGHEGIEKKLYSNCLTSLAAAGYLEKVPDEDYLNRFRYLVTAKGEEWIAKQIDAKSTPPAQEETKPVPEAKPAPAASVTENQNEIRLDKAVFDELYMVYVDGMVAQVCESMAEAQDKAKRFVSESGMSTSIHRIYSEPVFSCRPVTTVEFNEVS
ncbi:hypothetical protein AVO42_00345 [Thiomicrospira sp. XS5]|uniref:MarR family transcriptional regulator n=1 Tax=Thiomicrospira sp. XS5 TaxID=1775636 RepID=UPI000747FBF4|nr:MarR family transcriptional regulator [Thiomicrospira sp. XS5]KUJ73905.1 hypothetical protein AVO42_00345 [Thiomicrospira sp. XS5]